VRLILGILDCDLTADDFKYVRFRDGVVDHGVGYQVLVEEDGECVDRGKRARHISENLGRYEEGMVGFVLDVVGPDTHVGILLPVVLDVEWLCRIPFTSDFGNTVPVKGGHLAQFNVGNFGASRDCDAFLHDDRIS